MKQALTIITFLLMLLTRFAAVCAQQTATLDDRSRRHCLRSTPGGFFAAIAAAREGASVIRLEPTGHVGGMNTGGLSWSDSNQTVRSTVMGLFDEWHRRMTADYQRRGVKLSYDVNVKDAAGVDLRTAHCRSRDP